MCTIPEKKIHRGGCAQKKWWMDANRILLSLVIRICILFFLSCGVVDGLILGKTNVYLRNCC